MKPGTVGILNVGTGDTKLSFDPANPAERIRAARIVADMIKRGYALLVQVGERDGKPLYERALRFDEDRCEYIIADFDPVAAQKSDEDEASHEEQVQEAQPPAATKPPKPVLRSGTKKLPAETTAAVAVPRRAGG